MERFDWETKVETRLDRFVNKIDNLLAFIGKGIIITIMAMGFITLCFFFGKALCMYFNFLNNL